MHRDLMQLSELRMASSFILLFEWSPIQQMSSRPTHYQDASCSEPITGDPEALTPDPEL